MKLRAQKSYYLLICVLTLSALTLTLTYYKSPFVHGQGYSEERAKWQSSHHYQSMLPATADNILGKFDNSPLTFNGNTTLFYKKDDEYWVHTDDIAGSSRDFKIEFTFGFDPLQQYLVKTESGKYQVLPIFWDSRPAEQGGQRWAHIYGDDHIAPNDRLHWIQPLQNWNGMCADCHSTGFVRNYEVSADRFGSEWQTVNVSCKSCHASDDYSDFKTNAIGNWTFAEGAVTAEWSGEPRQSREIEVCAACHSLRTPLANSIDPSLDFLDQFTPTLIQSPQYYPDGQVKEEDYVWGSFLQSKMHASGVICSDCHDPHSLELKAPGNQMCSTCHMPSEFDTPSHHKHQIGSTGAECVSCHMPETTFMQVDARRDHSFRIPRPDLANIGVPDACTSCHTDMEASAAAKSIEDWFGSRPDHFGGTFAAAQADAPGSAGELHTLLANEEIPPIIRASGYQILINFPSTETYKLIEQGLNSPDPLIRLGAVRATNILPPNRQQAVLTPLLQDEYKAIRIAAFEQIETPNSSSPVRREFDVASIQTMWRGEGRYNLALFHQQRGNSDRATELYLQAQQIDPYFSASYVNLADLLRASRNERMSGQIIDRGLRFLPDDPDLNFSKALHMVRSGLAPAALSFLEKAVLNAPENSRYAYVYSVALSDLGQPQKALDVLKNAHTSHPYDADINMMLLNLYQAQGNWKEALIYAKNLSKLQPENININRIITDLQNRIGN